MKPTKKMIITQNLLFNAPFALVMVIASNLINHQPFGVETIGMFFISLVIVEILGVIVPVQKIAGFMSAKCYKGKNPMGFPQFLLTAPVLTLIFTILMTLSMTLIGMLLGGAPLSGYWGAVLHAFPWLCIAAYCSVMIFLPLSMKVSGMDKIAGAPKQ